MFGIVNISAVEDDGRAQCALDGIEVGAAKFLPFGHDGQRVGALERLGTALAQR